MGRRRPGPGPPRKRLNFEKDASRDLAALTKRWPTESSNPELTEESVVMKLVRQA